MNVYTRLVNLIGNSISMQPNCLGNIQNSEHIVKRVLSIFTTASSFPYDVSFLGLYRCGLCSGNL